MSARKFQNFLNISKYSLLEVHFNAGRLLFEFNCLQYTLAAPEVFVVFANPVSLPSRYRVDIVYSSRANSQPGCVCYHLQTVHKRCNLRMDLGLGRWIYTVLRQHPRIDLEEKHGRLLKIGSGDCRTFLYSVGYAVQPTGSLFWSPLATQQNASENQTVISE